MTDSRALQMPPPVAVQADALGFKAGIFQTPPHKNATFHFNNAFFERDGQVWMGMRRTHLVGGFWHQCMSDCVAAPVHEDMTLGDIRDIYYPRRSQVENIEDPRIIPYDEGYLLSLCSWERGSTANIKPQQVVGYMTKDLKVTAVWTPEHGGNIGKFGRNLRTEKNWIWFLDEDGRLCFIYMSDPWEVAVTDGKKVTETIRSPYSHNWRYGHIRGGTPPVPIGKNRYLTIFHSSIPWKTIPRLGLRMRYFMGAMIFEAGEPYRVLSITPEPLLMGSDRDPVIPQSPAVVFPCGLLKRGDELWVSFGVNDVACGWAKMKLNWLLERMEGVSQKSEA